MNSMNLEAGTNTCSVCNQQTSRRCSRCLKIYYCNTDHQRQDWKRHKSECVPKLTKPEPKNISVELLKSEHSAKLACEKVSKSHDSAENNLQQIKTNEEGSATSETRRLKKSKKKLQKDVYCAVSDSKIISQLETDKKDVCVSNSKSLVNAVGESNSVISSVVHPNRDSSEVSTISYEGSSEQETLSESVQLLSTSDLSMASGTDILRVNQTEEMPALPKFGAEQRLREEYPEASLKGSGAPFGHMPNSYYMDPSDNSYDVCQRLIRDMTQYGVCVLDNFLGKERGQLVLNEVLGMYRSGCFEAGQLVSKVHSSEAKIIRSDLITWIDGKESHCYYIRQLINHVDNIVVKANKMAHNGKMGDYVISGRTKAMVACYPGSGTHYVKHYDNPNKDGRCITAIYYLNLDWDVQKSGGLLRVFPEGKDIVADIAPIFDRMVFFWSDRRNPHEVQPAFDTRCAITVWYLDANERAAALKRKLTDKTVQPSSSSK